MTAVIMAGCDRQVTVVLPGESPKPKEAQSSIVENTAAASRAEALRTFSDLGKAGSALNRRFLEIYNTEKLKGSSVLADANWPMVLAKRADAELRGAVSKPMVAESKPVAETRDIKQASWVFGKVRRVLKDGVLVNGSIQRQGDEDWEGDFVLRGHPQQSQFAEDDEITQIVAFRGPNVNSGGHTIRAYDYAGDHAAFYKQSPSTGWKPKGTSLDQKPGTAR